MNSQTFEHEKLCWNGRLAVDLARAGLWVFPCLNNPSHPQHKRPMLPWGSQSSCDPAIVKSWWQSKFRYALPGIDIGKSQIIVLDGDIHHSDQDGPAELENILGQLDNLGAPGVITPSGGVHLYFRQPSDAPPLGNSVGDLPPGIDVRGNGGFVVAPGAVTGDKKPYRQMKGTPSLLDALYDASIPVLPDIVIERIRKGKDHQNNAENLSSKNKRASQSSPDGNRERQYALAALNSEAHELATTLKGGRNAALNIAALKLGRQAAAGRLSRTEVHQALRDACENNGLIRDDGKPTFEKTFLSGFSKGLTDPAPPLEDREGYELDDEIMRLGREAVESILREHSQGADETTSKGDSSDASSNGDASNKDDPLRGFAFDGDSVDLRPPPMLVKKLLPLDGVAFLGGQSGAGKTFLAVDLAVSVASGEPFFGHKISERVGVAIFAAEGSGTIESRVAVARNHKAGGEILPIAWLGAVPNLADKKELRGMIVRLRALDTKFRATHGVRLGLCILDTLAATFALDDENNNSEAAKAIASMNTLSHATKTVVMPVHHFGKSTETGLRGASAWRAGSDTVLSVLADRDQITGRCSNRRIALTKSRVGEEGWMAHFDLRFVALGEDEDGEPYGSCYVEPGEASSPADLPTIHKARPLPRDAATYLKALGVVLGDKGEKIRPFGSEGPAVNAVPREDVREEFYRSRPADGEDEKKIAEARRKAFSRGEDVARGRGLISTYEVNGVHFVWQVLEPPA